MRNVEELKVELRNILQEAAEQGVLIQEICCEYINTLEGAGALTTISIKETRLQ